MAETIQSFCAIQPRNDSAVGVDMRRSTLCHSSEAFCNSPATTESMRRAVISPEKLAYCRASVFTPFSMRVVSCQERKASTPRPMEMIRNGSRIDARSVCSPDRELPLVAARKARTMVLHHCCLGVPCCAVTVWASNKCWATILSICAFEYGSGWASSFFRMPWRCTMMWMRPALGLSSS